MVLFIYTYFVEVPVQYTRQQRCSTPLRGGKSVGGSNFAWIRIMLPVPYPHLHFTAYGISADPDPDLTATEISDHIIYFCIYLSTRLKFLRNK